MQGNCFKAIKFITQLKLKLKRRITFFQRSTTFIVFFVFLDECE